MCGIAGFVDFRRASSEVELRAAARAMARAIGHRGPDGEGAWADAGAGVALGHRRLSIVDLSPAGAQPMASRAGRFVISYNGEIYNASELRSILEAKGQTFRGHSDTEVIVEGCAAWGVEGCVTRLNGMFAMAIWDRERRELNLVRDRMGVKPLYWGRQGRSVFFGSELKALRQYCGAALEVDRNALAGFMRHSYIAAPHTIYERVHKLQPGRILKLNADGDVVVSAYWDIRAVAAGARRGKAGEDAEALEALLKDATRRCMIADVPLGALLSGGIDSSTVVALMQSVSTRPVRTFTVGFNDRRYNEAQHAKAVAHHLGCDHTEYYLDEDSLLDIVPRLGELFDEPLADPSQVPTYALAKLARRDVTVALSGDGGDEAFGGYSRYFQAQRLWSRLSATPSAAKQYLGEWIGRLGALGRRRTEFVPGWLDAPRTIDRLHKLGDLLREDSSTALYRQMSSHWPRPDAIVLGGREPRGSFWDEAIARDLPDLFDQMRLIDFETYLPEHCLAKVDRATMACGLEVRVPLLDHRVIEYAWTLPPQALGEEAQSKRPLRQVLKKYMPAQLFERPKWGFVPPIGAWLRGPLRDWAEALLSEPRLCAEGYLDPAQVRARWRNHLDRRPRGADWCSPLWNVLIFQAWLESQRRDAQPSPVRQAVESG
jgi:asparagine synthase (glutamine-hydrolysing)